MKIRLTRTPDEVDAAVPTLTDAFDVVDQSQPYPCQPPSQLVRVYLDVRISGGRAGVR